MYCKSSSKSASLTGLDQRETSWRSYSKSLIVELKEKLKDRRARTLALLSENGDLAAFNEIDTESDGLDETSANVINVQDLPAKDGATAEEQNGEHNSLSEATSITESDFNEMEIRNDGSKQSPVPSNGGNSRCISGSCSIITTISGGSYTSEDVSSRSLDDFVADVNLADSAKEVNYPCPHRLNADCLLCQEEANVHETYASTDNACELHFQSSPVKFQELNFTETFSESSLHYKDKHSTASNVSPLSVNFENKAGLGKARSDTSFCVGLTPETAELQTYNTDARLLMNSVLRDIQTNFSNQISQKSSSSPGLYSCQPVQESKNRAGDGRQVNEDVNKLTEQNVSANLVTVFGERMIENDSNQSDNYVGIEEYCYLEEEDVMTEELERDDIIGEELERGDIIGEELEKNEKITEEQEIDTIITEELESDEIIIEEIEMQRFGAGKDEECAKKNEQTEKEMGEARKEEKNDEQEHAKKEEQNTDSQIKGENMKEQKVGEELYIEKETRVQKEETIVKLLHNDNNEDSSQDDVGIDGMNQSKLSMEVPNDGRIISEVSLTDFDSEEFNSKLEKLQSEKYTLLTNETSNRSFSHMKNMLIELVQIFESNSKFYNAVDKKIVSMFEDHSADLSMFISAYENKSSNSGYVQTSSVNSEVTSLQNRYRSSARPEAVASPLGDRNRSLQTCLETAKLASTLQGKIVIGRRSTDNSAAVKEFEKTVTKLEKSMLDYLEVYAKEAVADGTDTNAKLARDTQESTGNPGETIQKSRHSALRRSDTFVVRETCSDKPPNISKRRSSSATLVKGKLANKQNNKKDVDEEVDNSNFEESPKAPHSSPTFLVTEDLWNMSHSFMDTSKTVKNIQDQTDKLEGDQDVGPAVIKRHYSTADTSCTHDDHDYDSDTSESISDGKETENLTYTSSLLAQLLDYNSAEECKTLKGSADAKIKQENIKTNVDIKKTESFQASELAVSHDKKRKICHARGFLNVYDDSLDVKTSPSNSTVKIMSVGKNGEDEKLEKYDYENDFDLDNNDEDGLNLVLPFWGLEMSIDGSDDACTNKKIEHSNHQGLNNEVWNDGGSDMKSLTHDENKNEDKRDHLHNVDCKPSSTSSQLRVTEDWPRSQVRFSVTEVISSATHAEAHNQDISPLSKTRSEENSTQTSCTKQRATSEASASGTSGNCSKYCEVHDGQQSHKQWSQHNEEKDDAVEHPSQDPIVSTIDWSSSDEEVDMQRHVSSPDILILKQKKDIDEKLLRFNPPTRNRRRKSRSPLWHKATDISRLMHNAKSPPRGNITSDISNLTADTYSIDFADIDSSHQINTSSHRQHQPNLLPVYMDTETKKNVMINQIHESGDTEVIKSASQLLYARIQEEQYCTSDKNDVNVELDERREEALENQPKSASKYDYTKIVENVSFLKHTHSLNPHEDEVLEPMPRKKCPERNAFKSYGNHEHGLSVSQDYIVQENEGNLINNRLYEIDETDPMLGKSPNAPNGEMARVHGERPFSGSVLELIVPWQEATQDCCSPKRNDAYPETAQEYSDYSNCTYLDQIVQDGEGDKPALHKIDCNIGIDDHRDCQETSRIEDYVEELSLDQPLSCARYIPSEEDNLLVAHSFNRDEQCHDSPQRGETPATIHQSQKDSSYKADCPWKSVTTRKIELFQGNEEKSCTQLSSSRPTQLMSTRPKQTVWTSDLVEDGHVESLEHFNIESCQVWTAGVEGGVYDNGQTVTWPAENIDVNKAVASDLSDGSRFFKNECNSDKYLEMENKHTQKNVPSKVEKQNVHSLLSSQFHFGNVHDGSLAKRIVEVRQVSLMEPQRSSLQEVLQEKTLSHNSYQPSFHNQDEMRKSRYGGKQPGYKTIDALRYKVNRLEHMLRNGDIIQDSRHQRNVNFAHKETPISLGHHNNCSCCQQSVLEQNLAQNLQSNIAHNLHPCCHGHVDLPDSSSSQLCLCRHCSCPHSQAIAGWSDKVDRRMNMHSKESQTSDDLNLCNFKSKTGLSVNSCTQSETSLEESMCRLLQDQLAAIHQEIREMKQSEECSQKLVMELDGSLKQFVENTSTTLACHSQQLEKSQVFMADGFKTVQDSIQAQRDISNSMKEYLTVTEETSEVVLQSLKSQQLEIMTRSVQTMEETLCPLQESMLSQQKEMSEIKSSLHRVVSCLEERPLGQTRKGMSYDTLKERIVELTSQRDAEKVFHRITRQSLRALERDHDRLRQEYIRATYRRNGHNDSETQHRLWYYLNNQDKCQHFDNNHSNIRHAETTHDVWPLPLGVVDDRNDHTHAGQTACGRHCSHCHIGISEQDSQRLPQRSSTFVDGRNIHSLHDKTRKTQTRDISKSKNKMGPNLENAAISHNRIQFSDHSHNMTSAAVMKSSSVDTDMNNNECREISKEPELTSQNILSVNIAVCGLQKIAGKTSMSCQKHSPMLNDSHFDDD